MSATTTSTQNVTTLEHIIFKSPEIPPIVKQSIMGKIQASIIQYCHGNNTPVPNNNFLITLLKTPVYALYINQIYNQLHVGEQCIYIIWDQNAFSLANLYEHIASPFQIHLAVGPHCIFNTIESAIIPYQIINIEKVNGDFMQNFEDLLYESTINVYCKIFARGTKQQHSHIVSPRYSDKFASPKTNYDKFINTVNISNRIKYLYIKNQHSTSHTNHGFFTIPYEYENKKPQSETNIANVSVLTPCKAPIKCLKAVESLHNSPIKTESKKLAPLSFNDFHTSGAVSCVNLGLIPRAIKSSEPSVLKRRTSIRIKRVLKIY